MRTCVRNLERKENRVSAETSCSIPPIASSSGAYISLSTACDKWSATFWPIKVVVSMPLVAAQYASYCDTSRRCVSWLSPLCRANSRIELSASRCCPRCASYDVMTDVSEPTKDAYNTAKTRTITHAKTNSDGSDGPSHGDLAATLCTHAERRPERTPASLSCTAAHDPADVCVCDEGSATVGASVGASAGEGAGVRTGVRTGVRADVRAGVRAGVRARVCAGVGASATRTTLRSAATDRQFSRDGKIERCQVLHAKALALYP